MWDFPRTVQPPLLDVAHTVIDVAHTVTDSAHTVIYVAHTVIDSAHTFINIVKCIFIIYLIIVWVHSAHLTYHVHKRHHNTATFKQQHAWMNDLFPNCTIIVKQ